MEALIAYASAVNAASVAFTVWGVIFLRGRVEEGFALDGTEGVLDPTLGVCGGFPDKA